MEINAFFINKSLELTLIWNNIAMFIQMTHLLSENFIIEYFSTYTQYFK